MKCTVKMNCWSRRLLRSLQVEVALTARHCREQLTLTVAGALRLSGAAQLTVSCDIKGFGSEKGDSHFIGESNSTTPVGKWDLGQCFLSCSLLETSTHMLSLTYFH
jgi:hypothetical protein